MQRWKRRRLWATTCSSVASSDLFSEGGPLGAAQAGTPGNVFPFLLMDEASQVAEPLGAAVLTRARPLRCLLLGDTRQLPPPTRLRGSAASAARSLFSRLIRLAEPPDIDAGGQAAALSHDVGCIPGEAQPVQPVHATGSDALFCLFQMRVQYRCHPDLGRLAAELFYGPFVAHGVNAEQRQPPVPDWGGALCCAVVRGGRESKAGRSLLNVLEAVVVA